MTKEATMTTNDETRRVIEGYFHAWTAQRTSDAMAFLADDIAIDGPTASYTSAESFRPALEQFAGMTRAARIVDLIIDNDRAALLYDCELPAPIGTLSIASIFHVAAGKIRSYVIRFDATELRKVLARKA
jgi:hypothetical protein